MNTIEALVSDFTNKLTAAIQADMWERLQAALPGRVVSPKKRGPGRPPKGSKAVMSAVSAGSEVADTKAPRKPITAKRAAAMARQGAYMAMLRQLEGAKRAKVQAAAKKDGVEVAMVLANKFLK
ncbi:MAG: hypothetical protein SGI86_12955 [Deltaproteobacteria bacterium]|nr:hypothetical protein [Deltaproteobacteria bacterium]